MEGALKLKDICYIKAEGYPAVEIKHGPIAVPGAMFDMVLSNAQKAKARDARLIAAEPECPDAELLGTVTGNRLAILGFAFKADTNDTREAPAIRICRDLLEEGAQLAIHDPKVEPDQLERDLRLPASEAPDAEAGPTWAALSGEATWWSSAALEDALAGAYAVLILTEWQHYRSLNWAALAPLMRQSAWVFDARSVVDPALVTAAGLKHWRIGEGLA